MYAKLRQDEGADKDPSTRALSSGRSVCCSWRRCCFMVICLALLLGAAAAVAVIFVLPLSEPPRDQVSRIRTKAPTPRLADLDDGVVPSGEEHTTDQSDGEESGVNGDEPSEGGENRDSDKSEPNGQQTKAPSVAQPVQEEQPGWSTPEDQAGPGDDGSEDESVEPEPEDEPPKGHTKVTAQVAISRRCRQWEPQVRKRYIEECGSWAGKIMRWEHAMRADRSAVRYSCVDLKRCHGLGDRIAGMETAFLKAIDLRRRFEIDMPYAKELLTSCAVDNPAAKWNLAPNIDNPEKDCLFARPLNRDTVCNFWNDRKKCLGSMVSRYTDRACITKKMCSDVVRQTHKEVNMVNLHGCAMRSMFEASDELMKMRFGVYLNGHETKMRLRDFHATMAKYFVIGIHMRFGDLSFVEQNGAPLFTEEVLQNDYYQRVFHCAYTVESFLARSNHTIHGRPVRYFLATDNDVYKTVARKIVGDKLIMFSSKPKHVGLISPKDERQGLAESLAEWFAIGSCDELVMNRISNLAYDNNVYTGRQSGFSMTSWLYQLKHLVYNAGPCQRHSLVGEGVFEDEDGPCLTSPLISGDRHLGQPHLHVLGAKRSFPQYYIKDGNVIEARLSDKPILLPPEYATKG